MKKYYNKNNKQRGYIRNDPTPYMKQTDVKRSNPLTSSF